MGKIIFVCNFMFYVDYGEWLIIIEDVFEFFFDQFNIVFFFFERSVML